MTLNDYKKPSMDIVLLEEEDVVTASNLGDNDVEFENWGAEDSVNIE